MCALAPPTAASLAETERWRLWKWWQWTVSGEVWGLRAAASPHCSSSSVTTFLYYNSWVPAVRLHRKLRHGQNTGFCGWGSTRQTGGAAGLNYSASECNTFRREPYVNFLITFFTSLLSVTSHGCYKTASKLKHNIDVHTYFINVLKRFISSRETRRECYAGSNACAVLGFDLQL